MFCASFKKALNTSKIYSKKRARIIKIVPLFDTAAAVAAASFSLKRHKRIKRKSKKLGNKKLPPKQLNSSSNSSSRRGIQHCIFSSWYFNNIRTKNACNKFHSLQHLSSPLSYFSTSSLLFLSSSHLSFFLSHCSLTFQVSIIKFSPSPSSSPPPPPLLFFLVSNCLGLVLVLLCSATAKWYLIGKREVQ